MFVITETEILSGKPLQETVLFVGTVLIVRQVLGEMQLHNPESDWLTCICNRMR